MSVRRFQRWLACQGVTSCENVTYSDLSDQVEDVRYSLAAQWLEKKSLSVGDMAAKFGCTSTVNFTRAVHR